MEEGMRLTDEEMLVSVLLGFALLVLLVAPEMIDYVDAFRGNQ
jgi:hypothetical protein